jgi:hypothetical protein
LSRYAPDEVTLTRRDRNAFWMDWLGYWIISFRAILL